MKNITDIMKNTNFNWFAKRFEIPLEEVIQIASKVKADFPTDEMMYELHLIRALMQREREIKNLSFEEMEKLRRKRPGEIAQKNRLQAHRFGKWNI